MKVIKLEKVTKIYIKSHLGKVQRTTGVEDINFEIPKGEVFGLLGLNGSGKTTIIKMMLGLLYPTKGFVSVLGKNMPDTESLKRVGYLPEAAYLNKYLTGRETVRLFLGISDTQKKLSEEMVGSVLERVGMTGFAEKRLSDYSKGMLQRISIAQALVHDPEILIFDEPITGLDPLALKEVRQLIMWLKAKGKTVFFSSHNISEVEKVCDRIGILVNGKLASVVKQPEWEGKEGSLEDIFINIVKKSDRVGPLSFMK